MPRVWFYQRMADDPATVAAVSGIHQSTSLDAAPHEKPFIMYRQTSDLEMLRGDDGDMIRQASYMVFVHDIPGDYMKIDAILRLLKTLFKDTVDQANRIVRSRWIETSDDLRDDDMGTIMRFGRVQVLYKEEVA